MSAPGAKAGLYVRTVASLRPEQMLHRLRLRGQRAILSRIPAELTRPGRRALGGGWPATFVPLDQGVAEGFPSAGDNAGGRFRFLGETRQIREPGDWRQEGASQLWRYHLHYFEWAWAFVAHPDREWARAAFTRLWRWWKADVPRWKGDAWSPYVASLRSWAWCGLHEPLVAGAPIEDEWLGDLDRHRAYLRAFQELDVGGNHLVKNLKALVGLGVFFGDDGLVARASRRIEGQLAVQILADGGHYERSPSYHCQVLGDLLDVQRLLSTAGIPSVPGLDEAISAMRRWLGAILLPDGDVPLFNDCVRVGRARIEALHPAPAQEAPLTVLQPSGYAVIRSGDRLHLVADIGLPCPPDLPAHAHADCLSFELAVDGQRVLVNSGVSTYAPGPRRAFERSTAAHNTVEVDGADQTEVWGAFRAARRARPNLEQATVDGVVTLRASHDGYRRLAGRPRHQRTWSVAGDRVDVVDEVHGAADHTVRAHLYAAPDASVRPDGVGPLHIAVTGSGVTLEVAEADVATGFGDITPSHVLVAGTEGPLPLVTRTSLRLR